MPDKTDRRCFLTWGVLGAAGVGAACSNAAERVIAAPMQTGAAQPGDGKKPRTDIPPGSLPCGKIGNVSLSRLFIGGNVIAALAHGRDLLYLSKLFKSYNTEAKIFETLDLAQECGVNTVLAEPSVWGPVLKYNKCREKKIQIMVCFPPSLNWNEPRLSSQDKVKVSDDIKRLVDKGATLLYLLASWGDVLVRAGRIDVLGEIVELGKAQGVPFGVGGHSLKVCTECEKNKIDSDFYVKTFHTDRYWSATPKQNREDWCWLGSASPDHDKWNDNMWCVDAEETAAFMEKVTKPWIAFKVLAAGAILPSTAFAHAYRHGADFIVAGMFDFQIEDDVKIAIESLHKCPSRKRPWYG